MMYENPMAKYIDEPFEFPLPRKRKKGKKAKRRRSPSYYDDYYVDHPGNYVMPLMGGIVALGLLGAVTGGFD